MADVVVLHQQHGDLASKLAYLDEPIRDTKPQTTRTQTRQTMNSTKKAWLKSTPISEHQSESGDKSVSSTVKEEKDTYTQESGMIIPQNTQVHTI